MVNTAGASKQVTSPLALHLNASAAHISTHARRPSTIRAYSQISLRRRAAVQQMHGRQITCMAADAVPAPPQEVAPARLPEAPEAFSIPEERLIHLAKELFEKDAGVGDESLLAPDFRFEFPVISLDRESYLKAVRSFDLKNAIPDIDPHAYHWRVDPYEPNRVWFTTRVTGTHTGTLKFGGSEYKATGRVVQGAPECQSFVFNEEGKCTSYTGGYIMDRRVGNTQKMGALFGILAAIGAPVPQPGGLTFTLLSGLNSLKQRVTRLFSNLLGQSSKTE